MDEHERDERWLSELFADHGRALLGYAVRRVDVPADAADVVAETFTVAWRRRVDVPDGDEARLWLYGVGRRVLANHRRGDLRRSHLADRLRDEVDAALPLVDHAPASTTASVVRAAVARLAPDDRELLWLTAWEGLGPAAIASVMRIPPGTVRSRLHRARQHLREELLAMGWAGRTSDDDEERLHMNEEVHT